MPVILHGATLEMKKGGKQMRRPSRKGWVAGLPNKKNNAKLKSSFRLLFRPVRGKEKELIRRGVA